MNKRRFTVDERFEQKVRVLENGCHEWIGCVLSCGYGQFSVSHKKRTPAHVYSYERKHGQVPAGKVLDHLCRNRRCCNPDHVEPVTSRENTLRGQSPTVVTYRSGICKRGHQQIPANRYVYPDGDEDCRLCRTARRQQSKLQTFNRLVQQGLIFTGDVA